MAKAAAPRKLRRDDVWIESVMQHLDGARRAMANLSYPKVVNLHDAGTVDERVCVAMATGEVTPTVTSPSGEWR
jgi:hypothetical protein